MDAAPRSWRIRGIFARMRAASLLFLCLLVLTACDDGAGPDDAGPEGDAGPAFDGGGRDAAIARWDAGPPGPDAGPDGLVSVYLAAGHGGRTMVSCDDGRTWVGAHSETGLDRCTGDCDHHPLALKDVAFDGTWFYWLYGWGANPSVLRRSRDGVTWEPAYMQASGDAEFSSVLAGAGQVMLADEGGNLVSSDHGETWQMRAAPPGRVSVSGYGAGRAFVLGSSDAHWSDDWGQSWNAPESLDCDRNFYNSGVAVDGVRGVVVAIGADGRGCVSADGGRTMGRTDTGLPEAAGRVMWTGDEFVVFGANQIARSPDGVTWTRAETDFMPFAAARAPGGAFVGASDEYDNQVFARSDDGVTWERLPTSAFTQSHVIRQILAARVAPEHACPGL